LAKQFGGKIWQKNLAEKILAGKFGGKILAPIA
jgi:hypothetical protein